MHIYRQKHDFRTCNRSFFWNRPTCGSIFPERGVLPERVKKTWTFWRFEKVPEYSILFSIGLKSEYSSTSDFPIQYLSPSPKVLEYQYRVRTRALQSTLGTKHSAGLFSILLFSSDAAWSITTRTRVKTMWLRSLVSRKSQKYSKSAFLRVF